MEEKVITWDYIKVGVKQYFRPTPRRVEEWLIGLKGLVLAGVVYFGSDKEWLSATITFAVGGAIDTLVKFIGEHPIVTIEKSEERLIRDEQSI